MSRNADILLEWGGEERLFRLGWGELEKLQESCDAGPFFILSALMNNSARLEYISEVICWGLVGGGEPLPQALKLVSLYIKDRPLVENLLTAQLVLAAAVHGVDDEQDDGDDADGGADKKKTQGEG